MVDYHQGVVVDTVVDFHQAAVAAMVDHLVVVVELVVDFQAVVHSQLVLE